MKKNNDEYNFKTELVGRIARLEPNIFLASPFINDDPNIFLASLKHVCMEVLVARTMNLPVPGACNKGHRA
jgi:hypothetical protein